MASAPEPLEDLASHIASVALGFNRRGLQLSMDGDRLVLRAGLVYLGKKRLQEL